MPANLNPPSKPFVLRPAHMDDQVVDYSPDWANHIVKQAYDGEIDAICKILQETRHWADQTGDEYPLIMSEFLRHMIQTLKATKDPNSITKLSKGGRPSDRRIESFRGYISDLVQIEQKLSKSNLEACYGKVNDLLYTIDPSEEYFKSEFPRNSYKNFSEEVHLSFTHSIEKLTTDELIEYRTLIMAVISDLYQGNTPASISSHPAIWSLTEFKDKKLPRSKMSSF